MPLLTSKGKRSFTYSVVILFILGIFASGYIFYFIPHNRKIIHKNGFLILKTIATNIADGADSRLTNYVNWARNGGGDLERTKSIFQKKTLEKVDIVIEPKGSTFPKRLITSDKVVISIDTSDLDPLDLDDRKRLGGSIVQVSQSLDQFLKPVIKSFLPPISSEFFQSYTLQKLHGNAATLFYQDSALAFRSDIADSLLPRGNGSAAAGIRDMTSQNIDMKMFYYPFTIGNSSFILSGFAEADTYIQSINKIPFYFIYPLVIVFLLALILLPVIKFYIMDSNESLRARDVIFFCVSSVLCASLLTILIIQFLLWQGDEKRVETNLKTISQQIQNAFNNELKQIYKETKVLDDYKIRMLDALRKKKIPIQNNISDSVRSFLTSSSSSSSYLHFDRISWIDRAGNQQFKAELYGDPVFTNVALRNYVNVFRMGIPYLLPGDQRQKFGWEPIYSWTNNEFNISTSFQLGDTIVAMASKMYSLMQTVLPAGYGFCIIDAKGDVLIHSDSTRSLRENFLEKTDSPNELKAAIASRQSRTINYVLAYGKLHMMRFEPLDYSMPFYLVSFYDEGYIAPINVRILIFTILLCFLSFITSAIMWWVLRRGDASHNLVHCKMDFFDWMVPKSGEVDYYWQAFVFTGGYLVSIMAFVLLNRYYEISNFNILSLVIVTPVNIILLLYCMRLSLQQTLGKREKFAIPCFHLGVTLLYFFLSRAYGLTAGFLIFQAIINIFIWIFCFSSGEAILFFKSPCKASYNWLITTLVVCLAVLPGALFTWYAHNQEFIQNVKRQQLHMANKIRERSFSIVHQKQIRTHLLSEPYLNSLRYSYGIYRIYQDRIDPSCRKTAQSRATGFERFYFTLAEKLSTPYYRQQSFAALEDGSDTSSDTSWYWSLNNDTLHFWYQLTMPAIGDEKTQAENCLHIASAMPDRYIYLKGTRGFVIALVIALLLVGLFAWLRRNVNQIFLKRFIDGGMGDQKKINEVFRGFFAARSLDQKTRLYTAFSRKDYPRSCDPGDLLKYEKEIVKDMNEGRELYNYIWNGSSEKEKFLLYGFATDGIVNYKNSKEIIELMNRGILVVEDERLRLFSPGFRAFILYSVEEKEIITLQKQHRQNSTWQYIRVPLLILLIGIAALVFFTQQGVFDKILLLTGGITTLIGLFARFFTGNGVSKTET